MKYSEFTTDCRYWIGYKPCEVQKRTKQRNCTNCKYRETYAGYALVIETGGLGSVLRSSVIAQELKKRNMKVQWITNKRGVCLLKNVSSVDNAFEIEDWKAIEILKSQQFNLLINFESSPLALALAKRFNASVKRGFVANPHGNLSLANADAQEFLRLQTDDIFRKLENCKSMQQILLETAGFKWVTQKYRLKKEARDDLWAEKLLAENGIKQGDLLIGLNIGSSVRQKRKRWPLEKFINLVTILNQKLPTLKIVVLAGPDESDIYERFYSFYRENLLRNIIFPRCSNSISQFISLVDNLSLVVSCDTFGMHVAIALSKKVILLHGPQPAQEIELYGLGKKIRNQIECSPCFLVRPNCLAQCMQIKEAAVIKAILELL